MMRIFFGAILLMLLVAQVGCWYSPWESLEYEAFGVMSQCHYDAKRAAAWRRQSPASINGVVFSVMLLAEGCYEEMRPPYTVWLQAASPDVPKGLSIQEFSIVRDGEVIWCRRGLCCFELKFVKKDIIDGGKEVNVAEAKIILPNVLLNPKDGKDIQVVVKVGCDKDRIEALTYEFRPKITRGKWRTID